MSMPSVSDIFSEDAKYLIMLGKHLKDQGLEIEGNFSEQLLVATDKLIEQKWEEFKDEQGGEIDDNTEIDISAIKVDREKGTRLYGKTLTKEGLVEGAKTHTSGRDSSKKSFN
jgi:hypothetical protein